MIFVLEKTPLIISYLTGIENGASLLRFPWIKD